MGLVLLIFGGAAVAQSFSVTSATGAQGDTVTVTLSYNAGGNADGLEGELLYDATNLSVTYAASPPALPMTPEGCGGFANALAPDIIMGCSDDGAGTITFIGNSGSLQTAQSGSFGTIEFTIANPTTPTVPPNLVLPLDLTNEVFADDGAGLVGPFPPSTDGMITVSAGPGPGVMDVSPPAVNLVNTVNGPASTQNLTISNQGAAGDSDLTANCALNGLVADAGVTLTVPNFMGTLSVGGPDGTVAASCSGTASGMATASYDCDGGAAGMDSSAVSCMVGAGVAVPNPAAGSMITLPVGPVVRGASGMATQGFSETNNAGAGYDVNCTVTNDGGGAYTLTSPAMQSVGPGGSVGFTVSGQSTLLDPQPVGTMVCTYTNGATGTVTITLIINLIPEIVPTLSQWGLILMILGLVGFGAYRLRRRAHIA